MFKHLLVLTCALFSIANAQCDVSNAVLAGTWGRTFHDVSGSLYIISENQIYIENFNYDGAGPDAFFGFIKEGMTWSTGGVKIPDENGSLDPLGKYDNVDLILTLPEGETVDNMATFTIWCVAFSADFGSFSPEIPDPIPTCDGEASMPAPAVDVNSYDNCDDLGSAAHLYWSIDDTDASMIHFAIEAPITETNNYIAFGMSENQAGGGVMTPGDVTVAYFDDDGNPRAVDYYLQSRAFCAGGLGACPDTESVGASGDAVGNGVEDNTDVAGMMEDGLMTIKWTRKIDTTDTETDVPFDVTQDIFLLWAKGALLTTVTKHTETGGSSFTLNLGRAASNTCTEFTGASEQVIEGWEEQTISDTTEFDVAIGPSASVYGYQSITGNVAWGIALYLNGQLIPKLEVVRGTTYTFTITTGDDPNQNVIYHPFYITADSSGGILTKSSADQATEFSGVEAGIVESGGTYGPEVLGKFCEYTPTGEDQASTSATFADYAETLTMVCEASLESTPDPATLTWTPTAATPDTVYYQCATHSNLGWKIIVSDETTEEVTTTSTDTTGTTVPTTTTPGTTTTSVGASASLIPTGLCACFLAVIAILF